MKNNISFAPPSWIKLVGCRQNNLKNFTLSLPKQAIIALIGVSGSGKSSLAFDILFAEGQRRYLEYLSSQTRIWIKQMAKPHVDFIEGLSPTLAISQGRKALYARGTIATYTDIYDFLSLLYATIGEQHSPLTGKRLIKYTRQEIIHSILNEYTIGTKLQLLAPVKFNPAREENAYQVIDRLQQMGFVRLRIQNEDWTFESPLPPLESIKEIDVIVDRIEVKEGIRERLAPSVETALDLSQGILKVQEGRNGPLRYFTEIYICPETGVSFSPLKAIDFNFNSPHGACSLCSGTGMQKEHLHSSSSNLDQDSHLLICQNCAGERLKSESLACLIKGKNISKLCKLSINQMLEEIQQWHFSNNEEIISKEILPNILSRLHFLNEVGLGYLSLDRTGKSLSDGEAQRIQLAAHIGAKLSGLIYILDEPSLGLHREDIYHLQKAIQELKRHGNTILLVEHEKGLISQADYLVELGPGAGKEGGLVTFEGSYAQLLENKKSITGQWLQGKKIFPSPPCRKLNKDFLKVKNASLHSINNLDVNIPLGCLVGFCGVSGSGKSTLLIDLIGNTLQHYFAKNATSGFLEGYQSIKRLVIGQQLAERFSSRSIPATYVNLMTPLRQLFAETRLSKARGYTAARFSLTKHGGRCEACLGTGEQKVNMQLMPDLFIPCAICLGQRFNYETLQVTWENRNIYEILSLPIHETAQLFKNIPTLFPTLDLMQELGLGYLTLGQSFQSLSGGEIQRLRLASDLITKSDEPTLYILDEPSSGLHFEDIQKLLLILHRLVDKGHSVFIIEHHLQLLQQTDWLIEMGPSGGPEGGKIIFEGTAEQLKQSSTPTGRVLKLETFIVD